MVTGAAEAEAAPTAKTASALNTLAIKAGRARAGIPATLRASSYAIVTDVVRA
jgi:hypothetical protein